MNNELNELKRQDIRDKLTNSVIEEEIEKLEGKIQSLRLTKVGNGLFKERQKLVETTSIYALVNKDVKLLLSRINANSRKLSQKSNSLNLNLINENITINAALTLKAIKSSKHLHEIENFTNRDLLLERHQLLLN